ncbi:hypothetical protein HYPSUDRAFT_67285 [Hypholoma sublateritium FD-334 SS-4]|uniref:Uncharacterized protein n=1 Tax=Hypholoma sublateritium (strain FD-334 SS-4) TaxID=945553 RepID=A0A0D2NTN7_HYPSF|nr:hypothetical protein HYPSUDRAFT_67285 [Hypholoma sublateritium FD-334 SS-4]
MTSTRSLQEEIACNEGRLEELKRVVEDLKRQQAISDKEKQALINKCKELRQTVDRINSRVQGVPQSHTSYPTGGGNSIPSFNNVMGSSYVPVSIFHENRNQSRPPPFPVAQPYLAPGPYNAVPHSMSANPYEGHYQGGGRGY